jgi:hypothetical protein
MQGALNARRLCLHFRQAERYARLVHVLVVTYFALLRTGKLRFFGLELKLLNGLRSGSGFESWTYWRRRFTRAELERVEVQLPFGDIDLEFLDHLVDVAAKVFVRCFRILSPGLSIHVGGLRLELEIADVEFVDDGQFRRDVYFNVFDLFGCGSCFFFGWHTT